MIFEAMQTRFGTAVASEAEINAMPMPKAGGLAPQGACPHFDFASD